MDYLIDNGRLVTLSKVLYQLCSSSREHNNLAVAVDVVENELFHPT